jgi:hypothetical protein
MDETLAPPPGPRTFDRFEYRGFHGFPSRCNLELIPLPDGRLVAIATERSDNPGTSVTNAAELLASQVCDRFGIEPGRLLWIEHYGYGTSLFPERGHDHVTFARTYVKWANPAGKTPTCYAEPVYFRAPSWRQMTESDWRDLGLPVRLPAIYQKR